MDYSLVFLSPWSLLLKRDEKTARLKFQENILAYFLPVLVIGSGFIRRGIVRAAMKSTNSLPMNGK